MGTILQGATLVELEPASVERADLRIEGTRIVARGVDLPVEPGDDVVDLDGRLVMPGLVSAHHRLAMTFGRGMGRPEGRPQDDRAWEADTRWRLEDALDGDAVELAAAAGALEALTAGTTTIFDQHASPNAVRGSLLRVGRGIDQVGLRGVLSWEIDDRSGEDVREDALVETVAFHHQPRPHGRLRVMVGAADASGLSDDALEGIAHAVKAIGVPVHLGLAEGPANPRLCQQRHDEGLVARWAKYGLLGPRTLAAHVVHLSWPELSELITTGAWLVHVPSADMERAEGYAPAGKFGARATLGTGGLHGDLFAEARLARLRAQDAGQRISMLRYLANGHRIATEVFGEPIGPLQEGAVADLMVLDYRPVTSLHPGNLEAHFAHGLSSRHVESVMVDGLWRLWERRALTVDAPTLWEHARAAADRVWARMSDPVVLGASGS